MRRKNPPVMNWPQAQRSQRISEAASHNAQASMRKRYHQMETEAQPGVGKAASERAWYQRRSVRWDPLPKINISGFPKRPAATTATKTASAPAVSKMRKICNAPIDTRPH